VTDLGVVDPIRIPPSVLALVARIRQLPPYAIVFLGAFVVRATADLTTALSSSGLDPSSTIFGLVLGSIPGWLTLLIPVAVAWSTATQGDAADRVVRGAIAVGLSEIAAMAADVIGGRPDTLFLVPTLVRMVSAFTFAGGLIWIAHGLEALRMTEPPSRIRSAAVVGVAVGLAAAVLELVARVVQLVDLARSPFLDEADQAILLTNTTGLVHVLVLLAWAYLAWVLVRSDLDTGRAPAATRSGAVAGWLTVGRLGASLGSLALLPVVSESPDGLGGTSTAMSVFFVISFTVATCTFASLIALVSGFARGLAIESGMDDADEDPPAAEAPAR